MAARINVAVFERRCAERGKSPSEGAREMGLSSATLAKIRRGEAVSQSTIEKAATWFASIAVIPGMGDLLMVGISESAEAEAPVGVHRAGVSAFSRVAS